MKQIAIVLWSGGYGGAETWSVALAKSLSERGCHVGIVLVSEPGPVCARLIGTKIQYRCLGLKRGRAVLKNCRRFSSLVRDMGSDAAILPSGGYMSAALRLGGYGGAILAVEHGALLQLPRVGRLRRMLRVIDSLSGAWAVDAHVVPSDFMLRAIQRQSYGGDARRIYLGVEFESGSRHPVVRTRAAPSDTLIVGFAGRIIRGKGLDILLDAVSRANASVPVRLEVAGDGPQRGAMEVRADALGLAGKVRFHGWVPDLKDYWHSCDLAVVPSSEMESFGMVAVEAMAAGLPVIAARNGGLAEVVVDGETGALFEPGNAETLSRLIEEYALNPQLRDRQGQFALARVRSRFNIDRCATEFLELVHEVTRPSDSHAAVAGGM